MSASTQRSRESILAGAKIVISEVGSYESNMGDIAARAQVSRATVYNHFVDKEEMMNTLLESEIDRFSALAQAAPSKAEALALLSREISADPALRTMVRTDPTDIAAFVTISESPHWAHVARELSAIFGSHNGGLVLRWLIGQIGAPLTIDESARQAAALARALS
jgi:AcrR family transcriptional regulator